MKYMGSKSRIAKSIVPIIQSYIDKGCTAYIEPFCGGMNVIDKIQCAIRIASDSNKYLIALWQHVIAGGTVPESVPYELYDSVRADFGSYKEWFVGAVGFLASYNGRFFDGGYGKPVYEKTKNGTKYRDYYAEAKRNIERQVPSLQGIEISCKDYRELNPVGAVIYCDPPYANQKEYVCGFDHEAFWKTMRGWARNNTVIVSEQEAPDDFKCIWERDVTRSIKTKGKRRETEKLFIPKEGGK